MLAYDFTPSVDLLRPVIRNRIVKFASHPANLKKRSLGSQFPTSDDRLYSDDLPSLWLCEIVAFSRILQPSWSFVVQHLIFLLSCLERDGQLNPDNKSLRTRK